MVALPADFEIDRLMNLIRGFGWEKVRWEQDEEKITVEIKKEVVAK